MDKKPKVTWKNVGGLAYVISGLAGLFLGEIMMILLGIDYKQQPDSTILRYAVIWAGLGIVIGVNWIIFLENKK